MIRNLIFTLTALTFSIQLMAQQMNISTNLRQDGVYDEEKKEWVFIAAEEEVTFFEFNDDMTMFKHITASITSSYIIKAQEEDEQRDQFELIVVSDVGNKYLMIIDFNNENVRFVYEKDGDALMVHHTIKKVWFDEE